MRAEDQGSCLFGQDKNVAVGLGVIHCSKVLISVKGAKIFLFDVTKNCIGFTVKLPSLTD